MGFTLVWCFAGLAQETEGSWVTWTFEPLCQGDCCALRRSQVGLLLIFFSYDFIVVLMEQFRATGRVGIEEERGLLPQE